MLLLQFFGCVEILSVSDLDRVDEGGWSQEQTREDRNKRMDIGGESM
jgi:hypothetical protein